MMVQATPTRRMVIVVRADPVICGHSGEARNLAEAALQRGFDDVRIVTWPIEALGALPLKPLESVLPYSPGIVVERPEPVGDYKVPDGRFTAGMVGRLVELFSDGVPTVCIALYLTPHASVVVEALSVCRSMGLDPQVTTIAEAVGSDITNVVRTAVADGHFGAAAHVFSSYLAHDHCVAVSDYTRECIIAAADEVDLRWGTAFGEQCRARVGVSYPAIDAVGRVVTDVEVERVMVRRGFERDRYVLFLSRVSPEKGVDDLIEGYARSVASEFVPLVVAGRGPALDEMRARAAGSGVGDRVVFLDDVVDDEKWALMRGCAAFVLPSKPKPHFVETFGIALVEKMLAGGGPVITTATGGIPEAVGAPEEIATAIDDAVLGLDSTRRRELGDAARAWALRFDRLAVFDRLLDATMARS